MTSATRARAHPATCACCRTDVRRELRRPLHYAETHIDVELLTAAMDETKARLRALIELELRRVADRVSLTDPRPALAVTPAMLAVLEQLRDLGRRAALAEAASMGVPLPDVVHARSYGVRPNVTGEIPDGLARPALTLAGYLAKYSDRLRFQAHRTIDTKIAGAERQGRISGEFDARAIMARAIVSTPGALDAAGRVVSMTLAGGMADVFEANADAFAGWLYSAVLDGATCEVCDGMDGTEYATWDEAMVDMPDGGPNPDCYGEDRCRCRLVPIPFGDGSAPVEPPPEPDVPPEPDTPAPPEELVIPEPFASSAYEEAFNTGIARDLAGVLGYDADIAGEPRVLELARADHEALMSTGREISDEIDRRVAALEAVDVTARDPFAAPFFAKGRAESLVARTRKAEAEARERAAANPGEAWRLATVESEAARTRAAEALLERIVAAGDKGVDWVRLSDVARIEREVLAERGVTFAADDELAINRPSIGPERAHPDAYREASRASELELRRASEHYPSDWVAASNAARDELKLARTSESWDRSHYSPGRGVLAQSASNETNLEVQLHELGHRMESSIPELLRAERAFYEWRARGGSWDGVREAERLLYTTKQTGDEMSVFDGWHERYMGKAYREVRDSGHLGSYEIVSQGMGELFGRGLGGDADRLITRDGLVQAGGRPHIRSDVELREWLLGALARIRPAGVG